MHPEVSSNHLLFRPETQESSGRESARRGGGGATERREQRAGGGTWLYAGGHTRQME